MRKEVVELIENDDVVQNGLYRGTYEGDAFYVVEGWDVIERIDEILNASGIEHSGADSELGDWGFSDEYTSCHGCGDIVRTSPTHYGWRPKYVILNECELLCFECAADHKSEYVQDRVNVPSNAIEMNFITEDDLNEMGFQKYNDRSYESGFYDGQTDNPTDIFNKLSQEYDEVVFSIDSVGQFDTRFSAWVRNAS